VGANRFESLSLPAPAVALEEAAALVAHHYGISGPVQELGSNQEANVRMRARDVDVVLKVANPAFSVPELDLQNAAMLHLADAGLPFRTPRPLPAQDGSLVVAATVSGTPTHLRLLTFVPGDVLVDHAVLADPVLRAVGDVSARLSRALADFAHPAADRLLQWDPRYAGEVVEALSPAVADPQARARVQQRSRQATALLEPLAGDLRQQVVHGDLADYNLLCTPGPDGRPLLTGVIDFGDVMRSWLVGDLATAVTSMLWRAHRSPLLDVVQAAIGFHAVTPLEVPEVAALWPLVLSRAAVLATSVEHQAAEDPANPVASGERHQVWQLFDRVAEVPPRLAEEALRQALRLPPGPSAQRGRQWAARPSARPMVDVGVSPRLLDLSVASPDLVDGRWDDPATEVARLAAGTPTVLAHGEARLTDITVGTMAEPDAVSLGVQVVLPPGTSVWCPDDLQVVAVGAEGMRLADESGVELEVAGVEPSTDLRAGDRVAAGDRLGVVSARSPHSSLPPHLHLQAVTEPDLVAPPRSAASLATAWQALCPNPGRLVGISSAASHVDPAGVSAHAVLHRRDRVVAAVQEHYFRHPPRIERGWREHLYDVRGRAYVDMVNNVTVLGHSHPAVADAAARQYRLLNTNSRFLYDAMVRLAERIVALLPDPLDTVFFVNSGSEAVDLALRLVRTATGRRDVVCLRGGYHGWTTATDEVSTSMQDNPHARETRPPWVHLAAMPNGYRGEHRGPDAADRYADDVRARLAEMAAAGGAPAGFLAEPLSGNAGGVELPAGYLRQVYAAVREAGGLCIADEVQVGYGRLGTTFWGFQEHDVVPDVVTMAKAAGNGHPLGFVVTRTDIAEAFGRQGSFFSSVGGSPVSCAVGLAVLDTLEAEGLMAHAGDVGAALRDRLGVLADAYPIIGTVHGHGLYQGVELVRDPETLEPATAEAGAVCERLLDLGVVSQPTGDHSNVLKVKPPLCISEQSADVFVDALDRTLRDGW
jgi:4-aminobutyrate aminotransferase-like enzyme/Ser/Thr protein kinase RdoA (MazF antagonist)